MPQLSKFEWVALPDTLHSVFIVLADYRLVGELRRFLGENDLKTHDMIEAALKPFFGSCPDVW